MPYTVFPLFAFKRDEEGRATCSCSEGPACERPGKHPAVMYSRLEAGEQILGPAGHAIATGARSGVFVVDSDTAEGEARFVERCAPEDLNTYTIRTPRGLRHRYYACPNFPIANSQGTLLATGELDEDGKPKRSGLDVRGEGGFVVMAGSPHENGGVYEVELNVPPRPAPAWLLEEDVIRGRDVAAGGNAPTPVDIESDEGKRRIAMAREACETHPAQADGSGGTPFYTLALHLVRTLELPLETAAELVYEIYNPRCTDADGSPWPWSPDDIAHKLIQARDKSDRPTGILSEGWADRVAAACSVPTPAPEVSRRRTPTPEHRYDTSIGDVCNVNPRKTHQAEVTAILFGHESWNGVLQYDTFRDRVFAVDPPIALPGLEKGEIHEDDITAIVHWFACAGGIAVSSDMAYKAACAVAKANAFHPLREYLDGLGSGAAGAIDGLCDAMHLTDPFDRMYVRRFLIAAVRRVLVPGCKVDNMLVLYSPPGFKKSTFVLSLFGQEWTSENLTNIEDSKAVGEVMAGKWAIELAEMRDIMRAGNETVAAFITRRTERFRAAYARGNARDVPRSCVLVGSTNETELLRNATGADARRFWIVDITKEIDVAWIEANRDAVWREALALAQFGERHWLEGAEKEIHAERMKKWEEEDASHDDVRTYCIGRETVRVADVWKYMGGTADRFDGRAKRRIADTLKRLKCQPGFKGKHRVRVWYVPEDLTGGELPPEEATKRASEEVAIKLMKN